MIIAVTLAILLALLVMSVPVAAALIILGLSIGELFLITHCIERWGR